MQLILKVLNVTYLIFIEGPNIGVGINSNDGLVNAYTEYIWEPVLVKKNALIAATEVII